MWDLSPLNKWECARHRRRRSRRSASTRTTSSACGSARSATAPSWTRTASWSMTAPSTSHADDHLWVCTNGDERADYFADATKGLEVSIEYIAPELPSMQIQGPRIARADAHHHRRADRRAGLLHVLPRADHRSAASRPGCREPGSPASWATRCSCGPSTPRRSGKRSSRPAPGPTAWRSSKPIRVETGMIVTGYDYDEHERSPYDLGLDRMVALDGAGEFMGKDELRAIAADPPNRFKTIRLEQRHPARVRRRPDRRTARTSGCSPARRSAPSWDRWASRSSAPTSRPTAPRSTSRCPTAPRQAGTIDVLALYDPKKTRPRA